MKTTPMNFSFEGINVRMVLLAGEPWWVARDLAQALEYRDAEKMTRLLDGDERGTHIVGTPSGDQHMTVINESGLYSAILRSRKASAKRFKKWVTSEVLPSIRKHGSYTMPNGQTETEAVDAPLAERAEADIIVSAGRVFRSLYSVGRNMGMTRRLAATRANQAAERATGVDLAAELGASQWLDGPDLPEPQRRQYELQQRLRAHLIANNWPQGITTQQLIEAMQLPLGRSTETAVGQAMRLLGYKRLRLAPQGRRGPRPYAYFLVSVQQEVASCA